VDNKYGQLFVYEDLHKIFNLYLANPDAPLDEILRYLSESNNLKFPAPEPVFLLRAQDRRALGALYHYSRHQASDASEDHLTGIQNAVRAFENFRGQYSQRIKDPD
jgi:hypothetical protein